MVDKVKWGLLFALEGDIASLLEMFDKFQIYPEEFLEGCRNCVEACDWLLMQDMPHYVNMGTFRRDLEKLREKSQ